jgi:two-component system chemotaxis sensor kinase CheA
MDDLISEFITETSESLALLDQELVKLEQNPNDSEILGNIFRLVHTIKGTCGFLGLPRLESVAHAGENVLGKIRDGAIIVSPEAISLVLSALDTIKSIMEHLANHGEEPAGDDKPLIVELNAFADSNGASILPPAALNEPLTPVPPVSAVVSPAASAPVPAVQPTKVDYSVINMLAPEEIKQGGGTVTQSEMDALERAFQEASPTIGGGYDFSKAPLMNFSESPASTPSSTPVSEEPKANLPIAAAAAPAKRDANDSVRQAAVKQALEADNKDKDGATGMGNQSIRVNLDVLETLMQMVGELVLTRNQLMQIVRGREDSDLKGPLQTLSHITTELQEGVMKTRMQPIGNAWSKFPRLIRDLSRDLNKHIELHMHGEDTELDRQLLEMIKDPLTHMVRNSCDHGLETPAERIAAGKPQVANVTLSAYHQGGHIIIEIADDGRGIDIARVKNKIIEKGLADDSELASMSDEQIMHFIFKPGFSTAEKVTSVSGRGVGMDVVRTNIEKIGGTVEMSSAYGKGSTFSIKIPLTLAIVSVLILEVSGERFAIPQINVLELVKAGESSDYPIETINNTQVLRLRDKLLPLMNLRDMLQLPKRARTGEDVHDEEDAYIVVVKVGGSEFGIVVDRIFDTEEIVVKPVSSMLKNIPIYSGNTILGDGNVIMILDPNGLVRQMGDIDTGNKVDSQEAHLATNGQQLATFLIFTSGGESPKAVPLELISRLEEIDVARIEYSNHMPVVQYRGDLMRLKTLDGKSIPTSGKCSVVVFNYDHHTIGLVVDAIVDIVETPLEMKMSSDNEEFIGTMVISDKTTDVIDVSYLLRELIQEALSKKGTEMHQEGGRILFVEDSPFFRRLTQPYLASFGYDVTVANTPSEAFEVIRTSAAFDIIITDIAMPEMDGIEMVRTLRKMEGYNRTPMIAFTSSASDRVMARAKEVGIAEVILKTNRETLVDSIMKHTAHLKKEVA